MTGESFHLASWKIENFSCWNPALHGNCIGGPKIHFALCTFDMKLYPRGVNGLQDHMVVQIFFSEIMELVTTGDLSFIGVDGSTLCTQKVHFQYRRHHLELSGPRFEEVIVKSEEKESDRRDQIELLLKFKSERQDEHHARTIIQICDFTMEVDPCKVLGDSDYISETSYVQDDFETEVFLKTGKIREDEKIELLLCPVSNDTLLLKTRMSLKSGDGMLLRYEDNEHVFQDDESWAFTESLTKSELLGHVRSIILHLKVISNKVNQTLKNVYFFHDDVKMISNLYACVCEKKSPIISHNGQANNSVCVLSEELKCLYQDQDFSDLQLKCGGVSFPVHKNILSARSTVFKAMLSTNMTEAASGCVDIGDLDPSTLSPFLAFLYTGAVEKLEGESALKLYYAADKYLVPSLKRECVRFLSDNVSVTNVCDVLSLGDKHQDPELTAAAHDFLLRNYNEVLKSKEWCTFMCSQPLLAVKTVTDFATKDFVGKLNPL